MCLVDEGLRQVCLMVEEGVLGGCLKCLKCSHCLPPTLTISLLRRVCISSFRVICENPPHHICPSYLPLPIDRRCPNATPREVSNTLSYPHLAGLVVHSEQKRPTKAELIAKLPLWDRYAARHSIVYSIVCTQKYMCPSLYLNIFAHYTVYYTPPTNYTVLTSKHFWKCQSYAMLNPFKPHEPV